uniref:Bifunctional inhibitor/plant lipid transfer protein/seed storage helical domain-containing protein n=1 Tax=Setaria viridis TaxID=4556 RepID=A0A4U6VU77_SETVI|nr:hypothetical protein SEVIR_2G107900v2 [Setaria viridis]
MAPKSAAALVLLAAMIAGLAPPLQAQIDVFLSVVDSVCSGDGAMNSCARQLVPSEGATIPPYCCSALLNAAITSGGGTWCACGFRKMAAAFLGVDVDRRCQAANNGRVAKLKDFCMGAPDGI